MCGIAGLIGSAAAGPARDQVGLMLNRLRHRGPDGEGILTREGAAGRATVVLGHRRLSIIDLTPAASQPMTSADGRRHIILNGEIYNYLELRAELEGLGCRFRTKSDTEVLLEAWGRWGVQTLDRVVGMFAFALLDESRGIVVLARDPFAIKPLYYSVVRGQLAFASEIPPLLDLPGVGRSAHPGALADFLTRGVSNWPGRTLFSDVRELPGAHVAEISLAAPETVEPVCYWRPPERQLHDLSIDAATERFRELLAESVQLHLRSDVPVGVLVSGGQDSSSVAVLARRSLGTAAPLHTFSYRGQDGAVDEGRWIEAARVAAGATGHDIRLSPDEWAADLPALIASQGEPFGSPVIYAQRRLFQRAAETGMKVVLDGQGSDEYLAGYDRFLPPRLASLLYRHRFGEFARLAYRFARGGAGWRGPATSALALRWPGLRGLRRSPDRGDSLLDQSWMDELGVSPSFLADPPGPDVLRSSLGLSLREPSIPWLMRYSDRNAMAFSIENRLPFLNTRLVDFALGLPESYFIADDGTGKQLLRTAMRGLVPDEIRARHDKIGFDVPITSWLPRTPGLADLLDASRRIPAVSARRAETLRRAVVNREELPRPLAFEAWRLVTLAAWAQTFGATFD